MSRPRLRFVISLALMVAWLCYLGSIVARYRHPVIVSRSQWNSADLAVLVPDLPSKKEKDTQRLPIVRVLFPADFSEKEISVSLLSTLELPKATQESRPESYLLLLSRTSDGWKPASVIPGPGETGRASTAKIYPWTLAVEQQVQAWLEGKK